MQIESFQTFSPNSEEDRSITPTNYYCSSIDTPPSQDKSSDDEFFCDFDTLCGFEPQVIDSENSNNFQETKEISSYDIKMTPGFAKLLENYQSSDDNDDGISIDGLSDQLSNIDIPVNSIGNSNSYSASEFVKICCQNFLTDVVFDDSYISNENFDINDARLDYDDDDSSNVPLQNYSNDIIIKKADISFIGHVICNRISGINNIKLSKLELVERINDDLTKSLINNDFEPKPENLDFVQYDKSPSKSKNSNLKIHNKSNKKSIKGDNSKPRKLENDMKIYPKSTTNVNDSIISKTGTQPNYDKTKSHQSKNHTKNNFP